MSYDIFFLSRREGQSWAEALEATEDVAPSADAGPIPAAVSELSVYGDEVGITVPYWHTGTAAEGALGELLALCSIVEKETGLTAYDPQIGMPLAAASLPQAVEIMSGVATDLRTRYGG
ncbi:hypothetical protein ACIBI4_34095 [Streptomyces sp. NPDC050418]|uniref:hypothetical protein n=1 Tax=Streptomyces sp. NPDC050418 TaxID=3365612 RepID=UPI00379722A9